jgi:putative ABC transport system ATP-binding protein
LSYIQTINLQKTYGRSSNAVNAVAGVNLQIEKGEFAAIIGASGSGKSTLLHLLGGLEKPTDGKIVVDGDNLYELSVSKLAVYRRRHFGFVFQFFNLVPILTVEENITLPILMDGKKPDSEHIRRLISDLGLTEKKTTLPFKLSGGQQQRVAIARALAAKPGVVFADEPTGSLDSKTGAEIIQLFRHMAEEYHQTMVLVTHDQNVASQCKRIIEMSDGYIISDTGGQSK